MKRAILVAAATSSAMAGLLLAGCSFQSHPPAAETAQAPQQAAVRPMPPDTLYTLLVSEMAASRGRPDITLAGYMQQAFATRDIGVTRHATLLAQFLHADQALLDAAMLWAELEPQNPEPVYIAGQQLIAARRNDLALAMSKRLLEMNSKTLFVPLASAQRQADDAARKKLLAEYDALLRQHAAHPELLLGRAVLQDQQGDTDAALKDTQKALRQAPDDLQLRLFEIDFLYKSGRQDKAMKRFAALVEDRKDNPRLRLQYARLLAETDLVKAREQFDLLAQSSPDDAELMLARALVNYRLQDYVQAGFLFDQLLSRHKYEDPAYFYLGEIAAATGREAEALENYRRVADGSEYLPATSRIARLLIRQGHREAAQQWMQQQRARKPDLAVRLYLLEADALLKSGDAVRSLAVLDEAVAGNPDAPDLYYARSLLYDQRGDVASAERDLRRVLAAQPDNIEALNALGYVLADKTQRYDEAYQLIGRALALRPDDASIIDSMGWVLYRMGRNDEAVLRLQRAMQLAPNHEIAAHLGEVLWVSGQKEAALKAWEAGLKLEPESPAIRAAKQHLQVP